ncbi:hypothetical protein ELE36_01775 [Pseudolysobacter antarcticus]|uniref:Organic solvent tolerance-like N-terminal domain-containing protein n=1 Tax=Pseudolysobacter antarcticus TaxID=2511995 RepID=A0A411HFE3_9GAMM|nr:hypothetical protein [Pseudolysobacter antarcticus]QBB69206.1 hypothetical protein ELE36_01775 [Pseudolysobacter antarcticus]
MLLKLTFCLMVLPLAAAAQSNAPSDGIPASSALITAAAESATKKITALHRRFDSGLDAGPTDSAPTISAGLRVIIDPRTHELRDDPANAAQAQQIEATNAQLPRPDYSKMTVETKADGTVVLHTNGQIMMRSSVRLNADGSYDEICAPSAAANPATIKLGDPIKTNGEKSP